MTYEEALTKFVSAIKASSDADYAKNFASLTPCDFEVERGRNYDKIVKVRHTNHGDSRSVHSFVVRRATNTKALGQTKVGDIHMAASWRAPAKHARGTIFTDDPADYGCNIYGANYLVGHNGYTQVGGSAIPR